MRIRRIIAIILIATLLGTSAPNPPEARADVDTAWIVIGSIAAYFGLIFLATWLLRESDNSFEDSSVSPMLPGKPLDPRLATVDDQRVRIGPDCAGLQQGLSVVCW